MTVRAGDFNRLVSLYRGPQTSGDSDGYYEALNPATAWVAIEPQLTVGDTDRASTAYVRMRFHPQVTVDCKLVYHDGVLGRDRELLVRGVQNIADGNAALQLFCEEIIP